MNNNFDRFVILNNLGEEVSLPINFFSRKRRKIKGVINLEEFRHTKNGSEVKYIGPQQSSQYNKAFSNFNSLTPGSNYKIIRKEIDLTTKNKKFQDKEISVQVLRMANCF
ncbi:MAG: hypothetical protein WC928_00835 [Patescibacteria group bacterium]|jgi:hypothetical protein